jgi:hypothetical protein
MIEPVVETKRCVAAAANWMAAIGTCSTWAADAAPSSASEGAALSYLEAHLEPARYLSRRCDTTPLTTWPDYQGRSVFRCSYTVTSNGKSLSAIVYLLNPSTQNIALRIGNACRGIGLAERAACGKGLAAYIVSQTGGQFPVAGFVIEAQEDAGGVGRDPVYLEFRDGNTVVTTDRLNFTDFQLSDGAMEHAARAPIVATRNVARVANATRADYYLAGGTEPVGDSWHDDIANRWPAVIRDNELRAQDNGEDLLLLGVARRMREDLGGSADAHGG